MIEDGGGEVTDAIKKSIKQKLDPFFQDVISSSEVLQFMKDNKILEGNTRNNEFSDALDGLECVNKGECFHRHSKRSPTLWVVRNHDLYKKMTNTELASDYWIPIEPEKWGLDNLQHKQIIQFNIDRLHKENDEVVPF